MWLSHALNEPAFDGAASVLIGLLLAGVAVLLKCLTLDVHFAAGTSGDRMTTSIAALEREISERWPRIKRMYIEPQVTG